MQKRAFTLIELAIVLTIIGLLIGGSFKVMKMMREKAKTAEAKELVLGAKNAVIGDTLKNYDLGLPDTTYFKDNLSPSKDLNHPIFYAPASNLVGSDICAFTTTDLQIDTPDGNKSVAFAIAHEGVNYNLQTGFQNNKVKIISSSDKGDFNLTYMNNVNHEFDDVVEWVTLDQLQDEVGCVDRPFRFVTDKLPNAKVGVQYPSVSGTAKLEVENALPGETVSMDCTPRPQFGIDFNTTTNAFDFYGTPTTATILQFDCNATVSNSAQSAQKKFSITIDPNYNKETNASCALDSECGGGYCVNNQCSSGLSGNVCVDGGDCVSGYCAGGICTTGSAGAICDNDGNCQSGICVSGICQTGAFDAPCDDNFDCKSSICQGGLCSGYLGDVCSANIHSQCLSGYCDANNTCALMPSGSDSNGSGGGGVTPPPVTYYTISSISSGSYKLNGGSCQTGTTTDVSSGTNMEIFKWDSCNNWWLQESGLVQDLDTNDNLVVRCNSSGDCD